MKNIVLFIVLCSFSCSHSKNEHLSGNLVILEENNTKLDSSFNDNRKTFDEEPDNSINDSILTFTKIFEIPVEDFFFGEALEIISSNRQHESSLYVPLKFSVKDSKFYIPNLDKGQLWIFSENGDRLGMQTIPSQIESFDYFEYLDEEIIVAGSFVDGKIYEVNHNSEIIKEVESQDVKFSVHRNNYIYRLSNQFIDRNGIFTSKFSFNYPYDSYDYYLTENKLFVVSFDNDNLSVIIDNVDGKTNKGILKGFELKSFSKPYILNFDRNQLTILLDPVFGRKSELQIIYYNILKDSFIVRKLKNPLVDLPLIGEGAALWGAGMVFTYFNNRLYLMYTDKDAIRIFAYDLI